MLGIACVACGRVDFDDLVSQRGGDAPAGDARHADAARDAPPPPDAFVSACALGGTPSDPLTLSGAIIRVQTGSAAAGVTVMISLTATGPIVASATSSAAGDYSVSIPTGRVAVTPFIHLAGSGWLAATLAPDQDYGASATVNLGEGTMADLLNAYSAIPVPIADSAGTVYVGAIDCSRNAIANVVVSVTPSVAVGYVDGSGNVDPSLTATSANGIALGFNVPLGSAVVEATMQGSAQPFARLPVSVVANPVLSGVFVTP